MTGLCTTTRPASGQSSSARTPETPAFLNQQRDFERELSRHFDEESSLDQKVSLDFGGWYSFNLFLFDDGVESSRTFRRHDLRLWSRLTAPDGAHEVYARMRTSYLDFNSGDSYDGNDDDADLPRMERLYYRFDLACALQAGGREPSPVNLEARLGRDLVQFGTGLVLSAPLDHAELAVTAADVRVRALIGRTVGSSQDIDLSRTATRTRRWFTGMEATYTGFQRHQPFVYFLWQRDHNRETLPTPFQRFDYDSYYIGAGSRGQLARGLFYLAEGVYEGGRSYGHRRFLSRDEINAWAFDAQLIYQLEDRRRTRLLVEYLFTSGDSGRTGSPTNSLGGNRGDHVDESFVGFGYRYTGLAFAPSMSNLHMWRAGAAFIPWPEHSWLNELEFGTDWFLYYKNHRDGAVSDPLADVQSGYLGWEIDCYANWRIRRDLFWTTRFGVFFPGSAFSDETTRTFWMTGVTWSF